MTRAEAMDLCREMYGRWTSDQIRAYLAEHGLEVGVTTVKRWGAPAHYEERRVLERDRARVRRQATRMFDRMTVLRRRGMTFRGIAIVLSVDFGVNVKPDHVRYALRAGHFGREIRRELAQ